MAKVSSLTLYCIEHEDLFTAVSTEACPISHDLGNVTVIIGDVVVMENNYCCFDEGFAFCRPPEEFFIASHAEVPSHDEMQHLDLSAAELFTTW